MGATVYHALTATTPDDPSAEIRPSHWNSAHAVSLNLSGTDISQAFSNGGNVSFGLDGGGYITASANAGGAGDGYNIVGVNGNTVGSNVTVQFSNANNVTFGLAGSTVTASASYPAQSEYVFANGGGVSFGTNGSTVTATVATNYQSQGAYLTTARASNDAAGLNTALTGNGVAWTVNSSGISLNVPAFLTTAMASNAGSNFAGLGETTGTTSGTDLKMTVDSQGVNVSFPKWITTARASNDAVGLNTALTGNGVAWTVNSSGLSLNVPAFLTTAAQSNHSHGNPTLALTNLSGTTASNSAGFTLSLSAGAGGGTTNQTGPNIAVAGSTVTSGDVVFATSPQISFGLNGSTMTASFIGGDLYLLGQTLTATEYSSSGAYNNIVMYGAGNVSLGLNSNSGLVVSGAGGGGAPDRYFKEVIQGERLTTIVGLSATSVTNRPFFLPFYMEGTGLQVNTARVLMSFGASSNRSLGGTFHLGVYSLNNSTQMTLLGSDSWTVSSTVSASSASWNGAGWVDFTNMSNLTLTAEGRYMMALLVNPVSANVTWMPVSLYGADNMPAYSRIWSNGATVALNNTHQFVPFWGMYSTTTGGLPDSVGLSEVNGGSSRSNFQFYAALKEV